MEETIIHHARSGDQRAFQQLVELHHDVVWRTARVLLADPGLAEDAVQEAWIDAWRGLPRFHLTQPFRPWLLTVVANRCRMLARRRKLATVSLDTVDEDYLLSTDDALKHILHLEANNRLHTILMSLSREQRQVLELRFFAELELAEIALVTGIAPGTVKSRLHRSLHTVRERFLAAQAAELEMEKQR